MSIQIPKNLSYLSELYVEDTPDAVLLTEYPSSNSSDTIFQNGSDFIIHDPFPPPPRELLKTLGPHHLMFGWGTHVAVTSEVGLPELLLSHWRRAFGDLGIPRWIEFDRTDQFITLFPHQSLTPQQQVIDPRINYNLHSKEVIEKIPCSQAEVLEKITMPCIAKLSHGYAGLGNFLIREPGDEAEMRAELAQHWPDAKLVINSVIENIANDYGVQFYLHRDGSVVWLGLTEQHFNDANRWCGGRFVQDLQNRFLDSFGPIVTATGKYLHEAGYHGLVGVDILRDHSGKCFLVDVNPRLTGITPFLMASRMFARDEGLSEGVYLASFRFGGPLEQLLETAESFDNSRVMVLSAVEQSDSAANVTICHLSVSSDSKKRTEEILERLHNLDCSG